MAALRHRYQGIQFDFENIAWTDRAALTELTKQTASLLRDAGFQLSIAIVSRGIDFPGKTDYSHWVYANWRGAFDIAELAKHADFLSVMTYDQHTRYTPPGPVAGFPWVEENLAYTLEQAPAAKVSLGIPLYGRRWYAGTRERERDPATMIASVSAIDAAELAAATKTTPQWDAVERAPWFHFYRDGLREYVFYNDARSFRERLGLARARKLHGVSCWVLGVEDPAMWEALPARP
jgi:spore germination protein YaaH